MARLTEISPAEWLENYQALPISGRLNNPSLNDNLFCCLQWIGIDAITKSKRKYWALEINNHKVSFLQSYYLSADRVRFRGLCTKAEFQRKGYMKKLISEVLAYYRESASLILCFTSLKTKQVCASANFELATDFKPRFTEYFDYEKQKWAEDVSSKLILMRKKL